MSDKRSRTVHRRVALPGDIQPARVTELAQVETASERNRKVLVADDDPSFRLLLEETLAQWGFLVVTAADGRHAWHVLQQEEAPRLVILDWGMPGMEGVEICRHLRRRTTGTYTYILLLTGRGGRQDIIEGLEAGADDYLVKPIDAHELKARLSAGLRILALEDLLLSTYDVLRKQATHDPLTGLWNQAVILDILDQELARSQRSGEPLGILMADLDHFKQVNDTYGHQAGNVVLREASQRIERTLRPYDTMGRYGGEEFLVVLPGCDGQATAHLGDRLRLAVGERPVLVPEAMVPVTLSLGAASLADLGLTTDAETLLKVADSALYRAKRGGRNRVERGTLADIHALKPGVPRLGHVPT